MALAAGHYKPLRPPALQGNAETLAGARGRIKSAKALDAEADYYVVGAAAATPSALLLLLLLLLRLPSNESCVDVRLSALRTWPSVRVSNCH